jgi:hypothetical protein
MKLSGSLLIALLIGWVSGMVVGLSLGRRQMQHKAVCAKVGIYSTDVRTGAKEFNFISPK